jgi:hypothetical protein
MLSEIPALRPWKYKVPIRTTNHCCDSFYKVFVVYRSNDIKDFVFSWIPIHCVTGVSTQLLDSYDQILSRGLGLLVEGYRS